MSNLTIEMPEDLVRSLQGIADAQHKTLQELAIEGLRSLVEVPVEQRPGSPAAVLRAMRETPHPSASNMDEFDAVLENGRLPVRSRELFPD